MKQRLVGAAVLVSLVVIIAPMVLEQPPEPGAQWQDAVIPPRPENVFRTEIVPVSEAEILDRPNASDPAVAPRSPGARSQETSAGRKGAAAPGPVKRTSHDAKGAPAQGGLGAWAVQLGSFSKPANARALRDRLRAKGYPAFIEDVRVEGRDTKRVYVGPELLRAKAVESRQRLEKETELKGLVVRYPTG